MHRTLYPSCCLILTKSMAISMFLADPDPGLSFANKEPGVRRSERWQQEGGGRELLRLAFPLILSSSFMTLQLTIDRALLSQASSDAVAAAMPAAVFYWTFLALFQFTA